MKVILISVLLIIATSSAQDTSSILVGSEIEPESWMSDSTFSSLAVVFRPAPIAYLTIDALGTITATDSLGSFKIEIVDYELAERFRRVLVSIFKRWNYYRVY